ncbi:unnamed protein product [Effrenium voratum]|uniref:Uncharacterized protein n=1 Tax=Effrenium voratum TaxID=2562239 RepID=A0AA36JKZ7_9DINO|nr:unnamed protein product [Effrenium voratum]
MGQQASCCQEDELAVVPKEVVHHKYDDDEASGGEPDVADAANVSISVGAFPVKDIEKASPKPSPEAMPLGHMLQKPMSGSSRIEKMSQLEVDTEIVRGISLRESLKNFGRLWRWSPLDLNEEDRKELWTKSKHVKGFDMFLSHTWLTAGRWKVLTLLMRTGWHFMFFSWLIGTVLAMCLIMAGLLPMVSHWEVTAQSWTSECSMSFWVIGLGLLGGFLGLFGAVYAPDCIAPSDICFLDVVSISQTDSALMERGIYGLGGFLKVAKELRVLWSPPYLSRLWCVFELAAYRTANPNGKLTLNPLFVESVCATMALGNVMGAIVFQVTALNKMDQMFVVSAYSLGMLPMLVAVHVMRGELRLRQQLIKGLAEFDLSNAECRNDFDREFIHAGIVQWYGSKEAFTQYVRGPLRMELLGCEWHLQVPYSYLLLISLGSISSSMEQFMSMWMGNAPAGLLWSYLLAKTLATDVIWQLISLKLAITLCDRWGRHRWPGPLDLLKSILIYAVFCGCFMIGVNIGLAAWTSGLAESLGWAAMNVSIVLIGLLVMAIMMYKKKKECEALRRVTEVTDVAVNRASETIQQLDQDIQTGLAHTEEKAKELQEQINPKLKQAGDKAKTSILGAASWGAKTAIWFQSFGTSHQPDSEEESEAASSSATPKVCRSCGGKGIDYLGNPCNDCPAGKGEAASSSAGYPSAPVQPPAAASMAEASASSNGMAETVSGSPQKEEEQARTDAQEQAKKEAAEKAQREAEEKAKKQAEEAAQKAAEEKAEKEADEAAQKAAEEKAKKEAEEAVQKAAEEKAKKEAEEAAQKAAEKAKKEAEEAAQKAAEEEAKKEAEEAAQKAAEEKAKKEAEEAAQKAAEEKAKKEAEEAAQKAAEEKAKKDAEEAAQKAAEEEAKKEAAEAAQKAGKEKAKKEAEEAAQKAAEEKAKKEAEEAAQKAAEEKAKKEAEEKPVGHAEQSEPGSVPAANGQGSDVDAFADLLG